MLRKLTLPLLVLFLAVPLVAATYAARSIVVHAAGSIDTADDDETELEKQMLVIQEGLDELRRSVRDPLLRDQSLATLDRVQAAALACKTLVPRKAEGMGVAERSLFLTEYRREMISFVRGILDLEWAVLDGDKDIAQEVLKRLRSVEDPAHERFMKDF